CSPIQSRGTSADCFAAPAAIGSTLMSTEPAYLGIVVAALGGAAIGLERQRSGHAAGPQARFGGICTFTLIGVVAGIAGWLTTQNLVELAATLAVAAAALVV